MNIFNRNSSAKAASLPTTYKQSGRCNEMHGLPLDINGPYKSPVYQSCSQRRVLLQPPSRCPVSLILINSVYPPRPHPPTHPFPQTSHCRSGNLKRLFQRSRDLLPSFFPSPASSRLHAHIEFGGVATFSSSFGGGGATDAQKIFLPPFK